ncbi:MAG TPA: SH3 domain-containing protein [Candidatus Binatia bacterium]
MASIFLPVLSGWTLILVLVLGCPSISHAAEAMRAFTVGKSGASLYSQQQVDSNKIATLQKGEILIPLAEAVGQQTWYMVRTTSGLVGWVRAADTSGSPQLREAFKETQKVSTWSAQTAAGRTFEGGWSVDPASSRDKAWGTWTLGEAADKVALRGTWSAQKFSTGWSGTWRASLESQKRELAGSWTADFPQARDTDMVELFLAAARGAIRGIWSADGDSGSWVIHAAQ